MKLRLLLPILGVVVACNGEKEVDSAETAEAFSPTEGAWSTDDSEYGTDNCQLAGLPLFSATAFDALVFTLSNTSETTVLLESTLDPINCTLSGMEMTCTNSLSVDVETYNDADGNEVVDSEGNPVDPDATTTMDAVFTVVFTDADSGTYTADLTGTCAGADCGVVLESLGITDDPCSSVLSGKMELQ